MGEILFVSRMEGDWAALSPPDRIGLWLNKDFVEGNRVVARSIQLAPGRAFNMMSLARWSVARRSCRAAKANGVKSARPLPPPYG